MSEVTKRGFGSRKKFN